MASLLQSYQCAYWHIEIQNFSCAEFKIDNIVRWSQILASSKYLIISRSNFQPVTICEYSSDKLWYLKLTGESIALGSRSCLIDTYQV